MTRDEYIEGAKSWTFYFLILIVIAIVFVVFHGYMEAIFIGIAMLMCGYEALCYWGSACEEVPTKETQIIACQTPMSRPPGADQYHFQEGEDIYGS